MKVRLVWAEKKVTPPVLRVETPMTGAVLKGSVGVRDEVRRREEPSTLQTLKTRRGRRGIEVGPTESPRLPETLVIDEEGGGRGRLGGGRGFGTVN
jgi:hypothetical protein